VVLGVLRVRVLAEQLLETQALLQVHLSQQLLQQVEGEGGVFKVGNLLAEVVVGLGLLLHLELTGVLEFVVKVILAEREIEIIILELEAVVLVQLVVVCHNLFVHLEEQVGLDFNLRFQELQHIMLVGVGVGLVLQLHIHLFQPAVPVLVGLVVVGLEDLLIVDLMLLPIRAVAVVEVAALQLFGSRAGRVEMEDLVL